MTGPKCASPYGATAIRTTLLRVTVMVHVVPRRFFSGQENSIRFNRRRFWLYSQGYFLTSYLMYNSGRFLLCNGASKELWVKVALSHPVHFKNDLTNMFLLYWKRRKYWKQRYILTTQSLKNIVISFTWDRSKLWNRCTGNFFTKNYLCAWLDFAYYKYWKYILLLKMRRGHLPDTTTAPYATNQMSTDGWQN